MNPIEVAPFLIPAILLQIFVQAIYIRSVIRNDKLDKSSKIKYAIFIAVLSLPAAAYYLLKENNDEEENHEIFHANIRQAIFVLLVFALEIISLRLIILNPNDSFLIWLCAMALIFIIASELSLQIKKENIAFIFSIFMAVIALTVDYYNNDFNSQLFLVIISVAIINNFSNKIGKYFAAIILLGYFSIGFLRPVIQQETFVFEDIISVVYLNVMLYGLIIISFYMLKKQFFTNRQLTRTLRLIEKQNEVIESLTATQERNKIAKEIHDTVGHRLTGALMLIEHSLRIDEPQERNQKLVKSRDLIKEALNDIRQSVKLIAHDSNASFQEKIQELTDKIQSTMNMEIEIINEVESLTSIHEHLLLRAIMECSTNTVKHSSANKASILIQKSNQTIFFTYTDNGVNEGQFEFGFGLNSMKQSVAGVGGVFHVYASHDGFTVNIKLPHYENNQGGEHE